MFLLLLSRDPFCHSKSCSTVEGTCVVDVDAAAAAAAAAAVDVAVVVVATVVAVVAARPNHIE